jgi:methionine-rich copper-binding protein CopC
MSGRRTRPIIGTRGRQAPARSLMATVVLGAGLAFGAGIGSGALAVAALGAAPAGASERSTDSAFAGSAGSTGSTGSADARVLHAKVTGSEPQDGATLAQAPESVTLIVDKKPATVEGDPLRVFAPDGSRVDSGRTTVNADGTRLTVALPPTNARPAGRYEIVYRLVSADTHLIAGRFGFTAEAAAPAGMAGLDQRGGTGQAGGGTFGLLHGWPDESYPPIVAGVGVSLVVLRLLWKRWRAEADEPAPLLPPMGGHLVDDRRRPDPTRAGAGGRADAGARQAYRPRGATGPPPPRRVNGSRPPHATHGRPR